jgi:adenine phosphoribosyltransferase
MSRNLLANAVRSIPDFPSQGIVFRDITTLLSDKNCFQLAIKMMCDDIKHLHIDKVIGIEARGFIIGGAIAHHLGVGFVPIRKKGKLPYKTIQMTYDLEYGSDVIEIHEDAISKSENVLLIDDLIATGGTAIAAKDLIRLLGGHIVAASFVIDLLDLQGSTKLRQAGIETYSLLSFTGQ